MRVLTETGLSKAFQTVRSWAEGAFAALSHSHGQATSGAAGFMSAEDKAKLDGIEDGATAGGSGGGAEAAEATPSMDGTAAVGSSERYAREDHVHPTDTTRAPIDSPAFTGVPTAPTAASGVGTNQVATTSYVIDQINELHAVSYRESDIYANYPELPGSCYDDNSSVNNGDFIWFDNAAYMRTPYGWQRFISIEGGKPIRKWTFITGPTEDYGNRVIPANEALTFIRRLDEQSERIFPLTTTMQYVLRRDDETLMDQPVDEDSYTIFFQPNRWVFDPETQDSMEADFLTIGNLTDSPLEVFEIHLEGYGADPDFVSDFDTSVYTDETYTFDQGGE